MKLQPGCLATAAKKTEDTTSEDGRDSNFASFATSREQWLRFYWNAEIAKHMEYPIGTTGPRRTGRSLQIRRDGGDGFLQRGEAFLHLEHTVLMQSLHASAHRDFLNLGRLQPFVDTFD